LFIFSLYAFMGLCVCVCVGNSDIDQVSGATIY
jgi:hypothetical protein